MRQSAVSVLTSLLATLVVLCTAVPAALAQGGADNPSGQINVAVLNLEGDGVDDKLLETLTSVLRNEAQQYSSYDIVNQSPVNLSEIVVVLGCNTDNPTCLKQAAEQLDARVLIYGRVEKVEQAHRVTIKIFDADTGKIERRLVRTLVNEKDPVVAFRKQIQSMFQLDKARQATRLQIGSNVEGAKIKVNGTMIGTAPVERKGLPPATYDVEVDAEGYTTWKASIELTPGADIRLWAPLTKAAEPQASDADHVAQSDTDAAGDTTTVGGPNLDDGTSPPEVSVSEGPNWAAWSAVGVGGVALAGSGVMAYMMSQTEDDLVAHDADRYQMSRDAYLSKRADIVDTGQSYELAHRVLLGVGAVSVVAGTVWLIIDNAESDAPMARNDLPVDSAERQWDVRVSPTGVSALVNW